MSDFEKALRASVQELTSGYSDALKDLHELCGRAGDAVRDLTGGAVELKLHFVDELEAADGTVAYDLSAVVQGDDRTLLIFVLHPKGYPIKAFRSWEEYRHPKAQPELLHNSQALHTAVNQLATTDSAMVALIAFTMRQKSNRTAHEETLTAADGDIPF